MMKPTMFDPIALEAWYSDEGINLLLQTERENYLRNYFPCFSQQPQRRLFQTFIQGLLSPLERKPIEPIVLHFSGEKYVRPMQQFFSRSPFDEHPFSILIGLSCPGRLGQVVGCCLWRTQALSKKDSTLLA